MGVAFKGYSKVADRLLTEDCDDDANPDDDERWIVSLRAKIEDLLPDWG
jgi:hypothetical protein